MAHTREATTAVADPELAGVQAAATAEERYRLAREIHDGPAQQAVALGYLVDDILAAQATPSRGAAQLHQLRSELQELAWQLRAAVTDLGPTTALAPALARHARRVAGWARLCLHLDQPGSTHRLPETVEHELLRIGQEAVTNAGKHAGATNLWVSSTVGASTARVVVRDDGHGLPAEPGVEGFGLASMRERAARVGAVLRVGPDDPARACPGTRVEITHTR